MLPATFQALSLVPIKVPVAEPFEATVGELEQYQAVRLLLDGEGPTRRIGVVTEEPKFIGWLPDGEPVVDKLLNGASYRAEVRRVIRGRYGRRFEAVVIEVSLAIGELQVDAGAT